MNKACEISLEDLLSAQFIAKNITLRPNKKSNVLTANNLTRAYGRGMEYAESRIYQPGDDVRHIDWRLTARHAKTYTKLYHEEKGENNYIILDLSSSMYFGTGHALKSVIAARTAAILAWLGFNEHNSVGSIIFNNSNVDYTKALLSKTSLLILFNNILRNYQPQNTESKYNLFSVLNKFDHLIPKNSRVFIISDFLNSSELLYKKIEKLNYTNLVYLIKITDPLEQESTVIPYGQYNIANSTSTQSSVLNITKHNQKIFSNFFKNKLVEYNKIIKKLNIKNIELISEPKWYHNLMRHL